MPSNSSKTIKTALISVFHKDGLAPILEHLYKSGVKFVSTGGTQSYIEQQGYPCTAVEELTGYPSILDGRVKTLHPAVFGGILAIRENEEHRAQQAMYNLDDIDLVIVDLYPFSETVASGGTKQEIIEKIDIGGISLIRAAAKNFNDVVIVASKAQYALLLDILSKKGAETTLAERQHFAREAFGVSSEYDSAIFNWFCSEEEPAQLPADLRLSYDGKLGLRYGENPHQQGVFYGKFEDMFTQLHGKAISYNNILDIDGAVTLLADFAEPTFAILKHSNPCGIATRGTVLEAWKAALACDPVSAFGGVLMCNRSIDKATAEDINKIFFEVIIAPDYAPEALDILEKKKNRIILRSHGLQLPTLRYRSALNGVLCQHTDTAVESTDRMKKVTVKGASAAELSDLEFALKVVKHCKSNAIVLAKDGQLCAAGVGQTSRVDSLQQAIQKAKSFGFDLHGAVMSSDAFFPFADCVKLAGAEGITAIVQPGGSIRDAESVEACDNLGLAMYTTGVRHFKH